MKQLMIRTCAPQTNSSSSDDDQKGQSTDWLALAHGPIVDIMITYGVLRGVVRLLDRRGRGTSPHLIVRRHIRGIRKR